MEEVGDTNDFGQHDRADHAGAHRPALSAVRHFELCFYSAVAIERGNGDFEVSLESKVTLVDGERSKRTDEVEG